MKNNRLKILGVLFLISIFCVTNVCSIYGTGKQAQKGNKQEATKTGNKTNPTEIAGENKILTIIDSMASTTEKLENQQTSQQIEKNNNSKQNPVESPESKDGSQVNTNQNDSGYKDSTDKSFENNNETASTTIKTPTKLEKSLSAPIPPALSNTEVNTPRTEDEKNNSNIESKPETKNDDTKELKTSENSKQETKTEKKENKKIIKDKKTDKKDESRKTKNFSNDSEANSSSNIIIFALLGLNLILSIVLFVLFYKTKAKISKAFRDLKTNTNSQIKELSNDFNDLEKKVKEIKEDNINIDERIQSLFEGNQKQEDSSNTLDSIRSQKIAIDNKIGNCNSRINELNDKIKDINDKIKKFETDIDKNQTDIKSIQNDLSDNFNADKDNDKRIEELEKAIKQFKINKNQTNYDQDISQLKLKTKTFENRVVTYLLKDHPECKWWIRFAEPSKIFSQEVSQKIIDIINKLQNKDELKGFSEFFTLYRDFSQIKLKCNELDNKINNGEIGFDDSISVSDFKQEIEKYNNELDSLNTQIENMSSIEIDSMGKKILAEERKKIINWILQELQQNIDSNIATRLSIEVINPEKGSGFDERKHDAIYKDSYDSTLPNNRVYKVSKIGYKDLLTGETTKAKVFVNKL